MTSRARKLSLLGGAILASGATLTAVVAASPPSRPDLTTVARQHEVRGLRARERALARAPADRGRAGLDAAREPLGADLLLRLRQRRPQRRRPAADGADPDATRHRGAQDRARQEHLPRASSNGLDGADPGYDYGTPLPLPGPRGRRQRRRLHHAHQPRRRRRAPRDAAGDHRTPTATRSRRSTARPGTRGPSGCCSPPRTPARRPTRRRPASRRRSPTSPARSAAAATRASRTTRTATSGSSRTSAAPTSRARRPSSRTASSTATSRPTPGDLAARQAAGAAGAEQRPANRSRSTARRRSTAPTRSRCTPTANRSTPSG